MQIPRWFILFTLAAVFTLLNSVKPLQVDDAAYYYYAQHISEHPFDPYGFEIFWYQHPVSANHVLAPPVIPYWWAAAIRLFGDHAFWWKLWLFPFSWLFVAALHAVFRRFSQPIELPLTCMTVFSPVFLPSLNYMLDVPSLALALAALAVFFRASDTRGWWSAGLAGLLAGAAMQTKYTAFLAPVTMAIYTAVNIVISRGERRRSAFGLLPMCLFASFVAAGVFTAWEWWIARDYGDSHFMLQLRNDHRSVTSQLELFSVPLILLTGGTAPWIGILGLAALTRRTIPVIVLGIGVAVAFTVIVMMGSSTEITIHRQLPIPAAWAELLITLEQVIYFTLGVFVLGVISTCAGTLIWRSPREPFDWFVVLWFVLEIVGYFALTPFAAVRRVMGIVTVGTVIIGRLAGNVHPGVYWGIAAAQMVFGLLFFGVDLLDAWSAKHAAEAAVSHIRARDPNAAIHFTGHWGFQFYGERSRMAPIVPDDPSRPIRRGDWLVVPHEAFEQQHIQLDPTVLEFRACLTIDDPVPLRTVRCFYGTSSGAPLEHRDGPRFLVTLYQAVDDFVPRSP